MKDRKTFQGLHLFFILDSIQTVFSNDNDNLREELNLDFSPEICPGKQVTFSEEILEVYRQINPTPIVYNAIDFST